MQTYVEVEDTINQHLQAVVLACSVPTAAPPFDHANADDCVDSRPNLVMSQAVNSGVSRPVDPVLPHGYHDGVQYTGELCEPCSHSL